jgi:cell division protein FtsW (lipid II flippase)
MWDRIAEGMFLIILVGGVMLYEFTEKTAKGSQGNPNTQPPGEIILSLLASLFFAALLMRVPLQLLFHLPNLLVTVITAVAALAIYILPARKVRASRHT